MARTQRLGPVVSPLARPRSTPLKSSTPTPHGHVHMHVRSKYICKHRHKNLCSHSHTQHAYLRTHICAHTHAHIHLHNMHTHTQNRLGQSHGSSGVLQQLLAVPGLLRNETVASLVRATLDHIVSVQFPSGNFPTE